MKKTLNGTEGFSLVELIAALLLASIVGSIGTIGVVSFAKSFLIAKEGAELAGTAQLAALRIAKEFIAIKSVTAASASSISFQSQHGSGLDKNFTIAQNGTSLLLTDMATGSADILAGNVSNFTLEYYDWNYDVIPHLVPSAAWTNWPNDAFPLTLSLQSREYNSGTDVLKINFTDTVNGNSRTFQMTFAGTDSPCSWTMNKYQCTRTTALCYNTAYIWATTASGGGGTQSYVTVPLNPPCSSEGPDPVSNNPPPPPSGSGGTKLIKTTLTLAGTPPFSITVAPRNIN